MTDLIHVDNVWPRAGKRGARMMWDGYLRASADGIPSASADARHRAVSEV
jgi:hypothetical protein